MSGPTHSRFPALADVDAAQAHVFGPGRWTTQTGWSEVGGMRGGRIRPTNALCGLRVPLIFRPGVIHPGRHGRATQARHHEGLVRPPGSKKHHQAQHALSPGPPDGRSPTTVANTMMWTNANTMMLDHISGLQAHSFF